MIISYKLYFWAICANKMHCELKHHSIIFHYYNHGTSSMGYYVYAVDYHNIHNKCLLIPFETIFVYLLSAWKTTTLRHSRQKKKIRHSLRKIHNNWTLSTLRETKIQSQKIVSEAENVYIYNNVGSAAAIWMYMCGCYTLASVYSQLLKNVLQCSVATFSIFSVYLDSCTCIELVVFFPYFLL